MHKHLSGAATSDAGHQHYLKSSFGLASRHTTQQQQQAAGCSSTGRAAGASGSSTPNSLYGFTPVSPVASGPGDDTIAQAWEAVEQFYSSPNSAAAAAAAQQRSSSRQQHYPSVPGTGYQSFEPLGGQSKGQTAGSQVHAAAAVQFAAQVSLGADAGAHSSRTQQQQQQPQQQRSGSTTAAPAAASSPDHVTAAETADAGRYGGRGHSSSDRPSHADSPQQQEWGQSLSGAQGAFGVQLMAGGNSLMAAMGGWVVNQAISAAANTALAAVSEPPPPAAAAAAAAPRKGSSAPQGTTAAAHADTAAAAAGDQQLGGSALSGGSSSWWRRFSSRSVTLEPQASTEPQHQQQPPPAAAAGEGGKPSSKLRSSIKAAAKRHGLRKKAAKNAAAGGAGEGAAFDADEQGSVGSEGSIGGSEGSAEYSQLLSEMDSQLRGAAAAGAAAAVSGGSGGAAGAGAAAGGRLGSRAQASAAAAAAAEEYEDIQLGDELYDEFDREDVMQNPSAPGKAGGSSSTDWLAAVGLGPRAGSSSFAASDLTLSHTQQQQQQRLMRAGSSSGGGGHIAAADDGTGPNLAHRARVLRRVLLWQNPGASVKALGFGVYVILLLSNIPRALHYMQVTTVLPGVALLYLTYNMAKPWTIRLYCSFISPSSDAAQLQLRLSSAEEAAARAVVWAAARGAVEAGSWSLALLALAHRALRARRFTTSCWTFVALWLLLLVSELRVVNQMFLAMIAYTGLFCVPWAYKQFRSVIDKVVYDTLHFVTLLVVNAERWAYAVAALTAALTWQVLEPADAAGSGTSFVVRCTASGLAGLAVLLWRVLVSE